MNEKISVTLTHCFRYDLLCKTIESFLNTNTYEIDEFLITDDGGDNDYTVMLSEKFKHIANIIPTGRIGQKKCLDLLFNRCKNNLIFHLEDDWIFNEKNNYIENSIEILETCNFIHQVYVRHESDNPHKSIAPIPGCTVECYMVDPNFRNCWSGFSWNPGLRRKTDYLKMFTEGFAAFSDEMQCSIHSMKFNYRAALLKNTSCYHNGWGDHVTDIV